MDLLRILCLVVFLVLCLAASANAESRPVWKAHPYLTIERAEVPNVLEKAERNEWAKVSLENIRESADKWLNLELDFPPSTGRHSVTYICSDCKEPLETLSPTQHQCPKCKKIYSGLPYDARIYEGRHSALAAAAENLGLASLLFDNKAYARKAVEILIGYADRYSGYSLIDIRGGQGPSAARISDQTLNESIWLIHMAKAYDFALGMDVVSKEEREKIETKLLRPSVETIKRYRAGKSNWQTWHNAGMLSVALCLQDEKLVDEVLNDPENGVYFQMKNSIMPDGPWHEGTWSYHFYSMSALLETAEAAYRSGINLYTPELKKAMEVPLKCTMPDGRLPALNDGVASGVSSSQYEIAAVRYGDEAFQDVIARAKRGGADALLIGMEKPKEHTKAFPSLILENSGVAILRCGDQYLTLDYGPHGGGHGHLDKLAVNYYTAGRIFAPDLGRGWPYNLPIHQEWYKRTLSHNTVTVDEQPQNQCEGVLESHDFKGDYHIATARADEAYNGVKMRRTVALGDTWLLDVFEVESDAEHTYDWAWHGRGEFASNLSVSPFEFKSADPSYSYLSNIRKGNGSKDWKATWAADGGTVYALFKGSQGRDAFLCDAPDNPKTDTLHSVILRDRAKETRFVSLFSLKPMKWDDLPEELKAALDK